MRSVAFAVEIWQYLGRNHIEIMEQTVGLRLAPCGERGQAEIPSMLLLEPHKLKATRHRARGVEQSSSSEFSRSFIAFYPCVSYEENGESFSLVWLVIFICF